MSHIVLARCEKSSKIDHFETHTLNFFSISERAIFAGRVRGQVNGYMQRYRGPLSHCSWWSSFLTPSIGSLALAQWLEKSHILREKSNVLSFWHSSICRGRERPNRCLDATISDTTLSESMQALTLTSFYRLSSMVLIMVRMSNFPMKIPFLRMFVNLD